MPNGSLYTIDFPWRRTPSSSRMSNLAPSTSRLKRPVSQLSTYSSQTKASLNPRQRLKSFNKAIDLMALDGSTSLDSEDFDMLEILKTKPKTSTAKLFEMPSFLTNSNSHLASELGSITKQLKRTREELNSVKQILHPDEFAIGSLSERLEVASQPFKFESSRQKRAKSKPSSVLTFGVPSLADSPKETAKLFQPPIFKSLSLSKVEGLSVHGKASSAHTPIKLTCSCLLKQKVVKHLHGCKPIVCYSAIRSSKKTQKRKPSILEAVLTIQRALRRHLRTKESYSYTKTSQSPLISPLMTKAGNPTFKFDNTTVASRKRTKTIEAVKAPNYAENHQRQMSQASTRSRLTEAAQVYMKRRA